MNSPIPSDQESPQKSSQKRQTYFMAKKLEVIDIYEKNNHNTTKTMRETGVDRKSIQRWVQTKHLLTSSIKNKNLHFGRQAQFPELEIKIYEWITNLRRVQKRSVRYSDIRMHVLKLIRDSENPEKYSEFRVSDGWIQKFQDRWDLSSRPTTKSKGQRIEQIASYLSKLNKLANK